MLSKSLELGSCGVQWTPPGGAIGEHTDTDLVVRDDTGLTWRVQLTPTEFAIAQGEEEALSEDLYASARSVFEARWSRSPRAAGARPRTADGQWSPVIEAKLGRIGEGRVARVVRRLAYEQGDEIVVGHLFIPVAKGTVEIRVMAQSADTGLRENAVAQRMGGKQAQATYDAREIDPYFPEHPLTRVRAALDAVVQNLDIVSVPDRPTEVSLMEPGCAITPPIRFVAAPAVAGSGRGEIVRRGVDGWQRVIDVWRVGRGKLKGKDMHVAMLENADKTASGWASAGYEDIHSEAAAVDDYGVCLQIEQYVTFAREGEARHGMYRWWVAGDGTLWRIGSNAPIAIGRETLTAELLAVQDSFRRI